MAKGILIDYDWCSGCNSCFIACQEEHGLDGDRSGIIVNQIGPWQIDGKRWQYDYVPTFTDECDLCASRTAKGKLPTCVHHCQAFAMSYGEVSDLCKKLDGKPKQVLYSL